MSFSRVTAAEAPEFFKTLRKLAEEKNIPVPEVFFHSRDKNKTREFDPEEQLENYALEGTAGMERPGVIRIGQRIREIFGAIDPQTPLSEEFTALISHELGHIYHRDADTVLLRKTAPLMGLAIGAAAYAICRRFYAKNPKPKNPQDALPGEREYLAKRESSHFDPKARALLQAKYYAAGLLGLLAGTAASTFMQYRVELRADDFSVEQMGGGESLARGLEILQNEAKNLHDQITKDLQQKGIPSFVHKISSFISKIRHAPLHPPMGPRIVRLRNKPETDHSR